MSEDYGAVFRQVQQSYQQILHNISDSSVEKITFKQIKQTSIKLDKMMDNIDVLETRGIDPNKLIFYHDKYKALYREFDNAAKNFVNRDQFVQKLKRIVYSDQSATNSMMSAHPPPPVGSQTHYGVQNPPNSLVMMSSRPPMGVNQPTFVVPSPQNSIIRNQPSGLGGNVRPLSPAGSEMMIGHPSQVIRTQTTETKVAGYQPAADPWSNHNPWSNPPTAPVIHPNSQMVHSTIPPPMPPPAVASSVQTHGIPAGFGSGPAPWGGPAQSGPLITQTSTTAVGKVGGPPISTTKTVVQKQTTSMASIPNDPWLNSNPWAGPPTSPIAPPQLHVSSPPQYAGMLAPSTEIHTQSIRRSGAKTTVVEKDTLIKGMPDPYMRANPWAGPPTPNIPPSIPSTLVSPAVPIFPSTPSSGNIPWATPPVPMSGPVVSKQTTVMAKQSMVHPNATIDPWQNLNPWSGPPTVAHPGQPAVVQTKVTTQSIRPRDPWIESPSLGSRQSLDSMQRSQMPMMRGVPPSAGYAGAVPLPTTLSGALASSMHIESPAPIIQGNAVVSGLPPPPKGSLLVPDYHGGHQPAYLSEVGPAPPAAAVSTNISSSRVIQGPPPSVIPAAPPHSVMPAARPIMHAPIGPAQSITTTVSRPISPGVAPLGTVHSSRLIEGPPNMSHISTPQVSYISVSPAGPITNSRVSPPAFVAPPSQTISRPISPSAIQPMGVPMMQPHPVVSQSYMGPPGSMYLTRDEEMSYKQRLDMLFSMGHKSKSITWKSGIEPVHKNDNAPFKKKKKRHNPPAEHQIVSKLQQENQQLKQKLRENNDLIERNEFMMKAASGLIEASSQPQQTKYLSQQNPKTVEQLNKAMLKTVENPLNAHQILDQRMISTLNQNKLDDDSRDHFDELMVKLGEESSNKQQFSSKGKQSNDMTQKQADKELDKLVVKGLATQKLDSLMVQTMGKGPDNRSTKALDKAMLQTLQPAGSSSIEKYMFSNEVLRKENQQIRAKLEDLQDVLEDLAKENMQLKELDRSGRQKSFGMGNGKPPQNEFILQMDPGQTKQDPNRPPPVSVQIGGRKNSDSADSLYKGNQLQMGPPLPNLPSKPHIRTIEYISGNDPRRQYFGDEQPQRIKPSTTSNQYIKRPRSDNQREGKLPHINPRVQYVSYSDRRAEPLQYERTPVQPSYSQRAPSKSPQVQYPRVPSQQKLPAQSRPFPSIQPPGGRSPSQQGANNRSAARSGPHIPEPSSPNRRLVMPPAPNFQNNSHNESQSLWINDRSLQQVNEDEKAKMHNRYVLPPRTSDLNKVNTPLPDYDIQRSRNVANPNFNNINNGLFGQSSFGPNAEVLPVNHRGITGDQSKSLIKSILNPTPKKDEANDQYGTLPLTHKKSEPSESGSNNRQRQHDSMQSFAHLNSGQPSPAVKGPANAALQSQKPLRRGDSVSRSFETFNIAETLPEGPFSQSVQHATHDSMSPPVALLKTSKEVLTRNKVAFFLQSLVLVKNDPNFEIAIKKSDISKDYSAVRIIFYVNNKTANTERVSLDFEYDDQMYRISTKDKLRTVKPNSQGRQQVTVMLLDDYSPKPLSFIICHLKLGVKTQYDILVPILFLTLSEGMTKSSDYQSKSLTVVPDKQFASPTSMFQLMPLTYINEEEEVQFLKGQRPYKAEIVATTKKGKESLKMDWFQGLVTVTGGLKWIDMIAWILADIRL